MVFATRVDDERIDIAPVGEGNSDVLEDDITEVIVECDEVQSGLGILHETAKIIGRLHGPVAEDHSERREEGVYAAGDTASSGCFKPFELY